MTDFIQVRHERPLVSYATVLREEGGRQHLKALFLRGATPFVPMRDPFLDISNQIDAQAKELCN